MFADLLDEEIQPKKVDIRNLPEIELPGVLRYKIEKMLANEEKYAQVSGKTSIVQTKDNYVFFSNQWLILAVLCKRYAEALKPYGDFFEEKVKGNQEIINALGMKQYDNAKYVALIPDTTDRERMSKYILSDKSFRPGKSLLNTKKSNSEEAMDESEVEETTSDDINQEGDGSKEYRPRSTKDLFCSCVLKQIPVPDSSSTYLGNLIYYLSKNSDLYNELANVIGTQFEDTNGNRKLPSTVKDCAKEIVDCIYRIDCFNSIALLFEVNEMNIKIDFAKTEGLLMSNSLRYMFEKLNSPRYSNKDRTYIDTDYTILANGGVIECRLSNQWKGSELKEKDQGNNLNALITVVNKYYEGIIAIKEIFGERYILYTKQNFDYSELPKIFNNTFSRRFITSLLAKPFVILTGNSGTGKTRISKQFAEYLECSPEDGKKNWVIIPVGADWTDNAKVLGFFNPLANEGKGEYVKTVLVELIEEANKHKDIPYFVILDEMNLSHVERYFSDFLSHMETPDCALLLDGYKGEIGKKGALEYPDNLFVVGTVNIDETTYMFSPKVLDRANVIEFKPEKKDVLKLFSEPSNIENVKSASDGTAEAFLRLAREIRLGKFAIEESDKLFYENENEENAKSKMKYVEDVFSVVYEIIEKNDFEFAFRTVKEIRQYISAAFEISSKEESFNLTNVIDEQLLQKVLPKIHGNRKEIATLLEELQNVCEENNLDLSNKKIEQMKGKLAKVQYASFI